MTKKRILLSAMMFLQFFMLPVWFVPIVPYVQSLDGGGEWVLWCGLIMGFGTFTSPLVGMFADRFLNAEKVLALCNFAGAAALSAAFFVRSPALLFALLLLAMCFYMPTWSLSAAIGMAHLPKGEFPRIRVFGTVGWVASGVFSFVGVRWFGIENFDTTAWIFACGAAASAAGGLLAFALPATPPAAKGTPVSVADALGLKALVLFKRPQFCAFAAVLLLAMIPFMWYNVYCAAYLKESGFRFLTITLSLGQVGEVGFMLLVPLIVSKWGYRGAFAIGIGALAFRNAAFASSCALGFAPGDYAGILVHGLIFGLLVVGSQMYIDDNAPKELRNQAQGLVNLMTAGVGVFLSNGIFDAVLAPRADGSRAWTAAYLAAFAVACVACVLSLVLIRRRPAAARKDGPRRGRELARAEWRESDESPKPDVSFVPAMERRRLTLLERAALSVAWKVYPKGERIPVVFASRWGEIGTTLKLMRQMHDEGEMSPAGFSNSVHNAAPGHLSLLTGSKAPYTAVAAGEKTYEMGLLEASTYPGKVLFVYAEESTPEFYRPHFPDVRRARAEAILFDNGVA